MKFKSDAQRKAVMSQYSSDRPTMSNTSIQAIKQRKYVNQKQPQLDDVYLYNGKLYKVDEKHSDVVFAYDEQGKLHQLDRKTFTANAKLQPKNDEQRTGLKRELEVGDFSLKAQKGIAKYSSLESKEMEKLRKSFIADTGITKINNNKIAFYEYMQDQLKDRTKSKVFPLKSNTDIEKAEKFKTKLENEGYNVKVVNTGEFSVEVVGSKPKRETKTFYTINNVGKAKYTVNWENSKGQPEIRIFKNKTKRDLFIKELKEDGYNER